MLVKALPDFGTCLSYSISARRNLVYIYKKQSGNNIDTERHSEIVKNTIDRSYEGRGIVSRIMEKYPSEEDQDLLSPAGNSVSKLEIVIIPNICQYNKEEQVKLVKMIKNCNSGGSRSSRIFIGMVPWAMADHERHIISMRDWLKHRFWIACLEPNETDSVNLRTEPSYDIPYTEVHCSPAVRRYVLDVMVHLRMHRFVDITKGGGIQTMALNDVIVLSQLISKTTFKKNFITPEHVKIACIWYFPLHIDMLKDASIDTTVQYGSRPDMIDDFLDKLYKLNDEEAKKIENPLFLETLVVHDVLNKIVPPV
ncbi:hypothetical protein HG535_0D03440 [Zygotorulaspora mrakii]|uniref:Uncharacterized protein n=1 Tax=Zygotorulaspora mrakii TaxID=42260 RepID=A0A7H9B2H9_ZYGMR|nr:uncharacterized protein HG535_0D03440 [Zygotorulaspora mrakii]QLG72636.1 hypothetical protein HG535_0D03440 [Zygotorulaspora mrakii]